MSEEGSGGSDSQTIYFAVNDEYIAFSAESAEAAEYALAVDPKFVYMVGNVVGGIAIGAFCSAVPFLVGYRQKRSFWA